jgi:hypothetical protein
MKPWVHDDLRFEVQQRFLDSCTKQKRPLSPEDEDMIYSISKQVVYLKYRAEWVRFQKAHGLGVFNETPKDRR